MPYKFHKASVQFASDGEAEFDGTEKITISDETVKKYFFHPNDNRFYTAKLIPGSKAEVILYGMIQKVRLYYLLMSQAFVGRQRRFLWFLQPAI